MRSTGASPPPPATTRSPPWPPPPTTCSTGSPPPSPPHRPSPPPPPPRRAARPPPPPAPAGAEAAAAAGAAGAAGGGAAGGVAWGRVASDGRAVRAEPRARIFEPFARIDGARSARSGGAGLGLAIARRIARAHNGDLTLDPATEGASFRLTLPLAT